MSDNGMYRILTIDDEADIRISFRRYLGDFGYEVLEAKNGRDGIALFMEKHPDLILVDLRMPDIDGLEVISAVKKASPDTPVIVVSGTGNINDAIEALRLGAWDYLLKPVEDLAVLRHAVEKGLERSRLLTENRAYQTHLEEEVKKRTVELNRALEELRENERRYRIVAEFTYDWEYWEKPDGNIEYVSPSCRRISGYDPLEFIANPSLFTEIVFAADRHIWTEHAHDAQSEHRLREIRFRIITADGSTRWIEHACQPVIDENGTFLGIRASNRDISEREKLAAELRQAQKIEAIGTLAGGIAHDFNNILSAIFGYTELARMRADDTHPQLVEDLNQVHMAAERARDLVRQILTFSRRGEQEKRPLEVALIVKEALKLLRATIPATIVIRENMVSNGTVLADPSQIHQVVMNLCTNAYHAMRDNGGTLNIDLRETEITVKDKAPDLVMPPGRYLRLEVSDTGIGMDRKTREHIFEPYFTTKDPSEGTGLGLAVVHGIVKSHQGHINVCSEPDRGTTFHVYLPMSGKVIREADVSPTGKPLRKEHGRILFVDDEKQITAMAAEILSLYGYQVTTFADSEKAWQEFKKNPAGYDLVVTDMSMPFLTGPELATKIKGLRPTMPIILCSGFGDTIDRDRTPGIDEYMAKPLIMSQLAESIAKLL